MATVLEIQEIVQIIRDAKDASERSAVRAMVATTKKAESFAKRNSTRQFTGRNDRYLSGRLLNSIYSGQERLAAGEISGFIGVRDIPYGAIHEFGGIINPKATNRMQRLWIPKRANAGRMTPREFIALKRAQPDRFFLNDKVAGRWTDDRKTRLIPLFFLVRQVKIPERPYMRPAMEEAMDYYPQYYAQFRLEEMRA